MTRWRKSLEQMRTSPSNVRFDRLCALVERLGYELQGRTATSHRVYRRAGLPVINLQAGAHGMAKAYQVKQVIDIIDSWELEV